MPHGVSYDPYKLRKANPRTFFVMIHNTSFQSLAIYGIFATYNE